MIFITLGTQDKSFSRLLKAVEKQIKNGNIKEKVVAQIGCTSFKSDCMELFDYIPMDDFNKYLLDASIIITHGGVGNILSALNYGKKVIAFPRLAKYKEHVNDHQKQIVDEFYNNKYILTGEVNKLDIILEEIKEFKPKKYKSNNGKFNDLIINYIEKN